MKGRLNLKLRMRHKFCCCCCCYSRMISIRTIHPFSFNLSEKKENKLLNFIIIAIILIQIPVSFFLLLIVQFISQPKLNHNHVNVKKKIYRQLKQMKMIILFYLFFQLQPKKNIQ